jgi:hypothetical protein
MSGSTAVLLVIVFGVFGVFAGWHWKLTHRSWQDYRTARRTARRGTPALRAARSRKTLRAFLFGLGALLLLFLLAKGR